MPLIEPADPSVAAVMRQAADIVDRALAAMTTKAGHDATVCGCPSCRADAAACLTWCAEMERAEEVG